MSQKLQCRPSELGDIDDGYVAYCFDEAVVVFGATVQQEIDDILNNPKEKNEATKQAKATTHLSRRLGEQPKFKQPSMTSPVGRR